MAMRIQEKASGNTAVIVVLDAVVSRLDKCVFCGRVRCLIENGILEVVVDFSNVRWLGAATLGVLVASLRILGSAGGDLRLAGISQKMDRVLALTGLAGVFPTLDHVDGAVAGFEGKALDFAA